MGLRGRPHYDAAMNPVPAGSAAARRPFGESLRQWRQQRRLSQLDLAQQADVSARHLSFVETGRSVPSREMVLRLASRLEVPLRERNAMLMAAGYAPMYRERPLDHPDLALARQAVDTILKSHEPYPALAIDRHWQLVSGNAVVPHLLAAADPSLMAPPVNVLRLTLHPRGLAPNIVNLGQWRRHLLERLAQQIQVTGDRVLVALMEELRTYPFAAAGDDVHLHGEHPGVVVPFRLRTGSAVLSFFSTTTVFGTPVDITLQELALEAFFPADPRTGELLRQLMTAGPLP